MKRDDLLAKLEAQQVPAGPINDLEQVFNDPQVFIRGRAFVIPDAERGFALRPGFDQEGIHINAAGFRGPELPADLQQKQLVIALGNRGHSAGWCRTAKPIQAPAARLEERHPARAPYVLNAGVPSYTSAQVLAYMRQLLPRHRPDVAIVSVLWNDVLYSMIPNWLPEYLVHQQPAPWRQFLLRHSGLYRAIVIRAADPATSPDVENHEALAYYKRNLMEMIRECEKSGVRLLLVRPSVDPAHISDLGVGIGIRTLGKQSFLKLLQEYVAAFEEVARANGVPIVENRLSRGDAKNAGHFIDVAHLNGAGNQLLAQDVATALIEHGLLEEPPPRRHRAESGSRPRPTLRSPEPRPSHNGEHDAADPAVPQSGASCGSSPSSSRQRSSGRS
jgi:lysophospholipase L1-like esterase